MRKGFPTAVVAMTTAALLAPAVAQAHHVAGGTMKIAVPSWLVNFKHTVIFSLSPASLVVGTLRRGHTVFPRRQASNRCFTLTGLARGIITARHHQRKL